MMIPRGLPNAEQAGRHDNDPEIDYREWWGKPVQQGLWLTGRESAEWAVQQLAERIADEARVGDQGEVRDVGCGDGGTSRWLVRKRNAKMVDVRRVWPARLLIAWSTDHPV